MTGLSQGSRSARRQAFRDLLWGLDHPCPVRPQCRDHGEPRDLGLGVGLVGLARGNMTVAETATALHCSVNQIRERLHLPADASDSERLGQIAKQRGITMPEIRKQLEP